MLSITPGSSLYQIDVAIFDNSVVETIGYQNFSLRLSSEERSVTFTNRTTVVTIYDNDCKLLIKIMSDSFGLLQFLIVK